MQTASSCWLWCLSASSVSIQTQSTWRNPQAQICFQWLSPGLGRLSLRCTQPVWMSWGRVCQWQFWRSCRRIFWRLRCWRTPFRQFQKERRSHGISDGPWWERPFWWRCLWPRPQFWRSCICTQDAVCKPRLVHTYGWNRRCWSKISHRPRQWRSAVSSTPLSISRSSRSSPRSTPDVPKAVNQFNTFRSWIIFAGQLSLPRTSA